MNQHVIEYYRLRLMASIRRNKMYLCYSNGVILNKPEILNK